MSGKKSLSNSELREALIQLGENPGPISAATRGVYIKRLERLIKNRRTPHDAGETAASDEKNNKKTATITKTSKIPTRKAFGFSSDESDTNGGVENSKPREVAKSSKTAAAVTAKLRSTTRHEASAAASNHAANKTLADVVATSSSGSVVAMTPQTTNGYSDNDEDDNSNNDDDDDVKMVDVSCSPMSGSDSPNSSALNKYKSRPLVKSTTPNKLRLRSHLNNFYAKTTTAKISVDEPPLLTSTPTSTTKTASYVTRVAPPSSLSSLGDKKRDENGGLKVTSKSKSSLYLPSLLLYSTLFFFIMLAALYVAMKTDHHQQQQQPNMLGEDMDLKMRYVNQIFEVLGSAAGKKICNYTTEDRLHVSQIQTLAKMNENEFRESLGLICQHPKWQIHLYQVTDLDDGGDFVTRIIDNCDEVAMVTHMSSGQAFLPATCRLARAFKKIVTNLLLLTLFASSLWGCYRLYAYWREKVEQEQSEIYNLVDKIIDLVRNQHEQIGVEDGEKVMPIVQARDILIPHSDRRKLSGVWRKAVEAVGDDSRLRIETQRVNGQDLLVWKWVQVRSACSSPSNASSSTSSPHHRTWQGEAFDKGVNAPAVSPSSCLKLRNVFNPEMERNNSCWEYEIQDAILEKCSSCKNIVAIVVEKSSHEGLVYIKCGSNEEAGKMFRTLHGSWFDGRLITVKFLKLKRFELRYPHYADVTTPMKHHHKHQVSVFNSHLNSSAN